LKFRFRILAPAQIDLEEIYAYMQAQAPALANEQLLRLLDAIESLSSRPQRGARPKDPEVRSRGYRMLISTPYLGFYRIDGKTVRVERILHSSRSYHGLL
jgi:plasmid stabilization system protein ParE